MKSQGNNARVFGLLLAFGVMLATKGWAQIEIGANTNMTMSGDLGFGYNGSYGSLQNSSHGLNVNGDAVLQGYYYNPKFLSYFVDPIYNRSQANSGQGSLTNATSINTGVNLFSGSHFPGSVSFGESFNNSSNYGFGTTPGLTATGNSRNFGVGWAELIPGVPPLNVQYSQTTSSSSIFGSDQEDHSNAKTLNAFSNYKLDGWFMGARFTDIWTHTDLPAAVTGNEAITGDTNGKTFAFNASHKLPLHGSLGAGYTWSDFTGESDGAGFTGSNQTINATAAFVPTRRLTTSFQLNYDSNLTGEIEQQLIGVGAVAPQVNLGRSGYSISFSNFDNVVIGKGLSAGFNVSHIEQEAFGRTLEATHFTGVVNYQFLKPIWGTMVVYAGVNDQATDAGNTGAGLVGGVNFSKRWSNTEVSGSFAYSQFTETVLATQVTSSYSYSANAQRRLSRRTRWLTTFNGFHTGFDATAGSSAHEESFGTQLVFKMYNLGANYSRTSGTVLLTAGGLVLTPGNLPPSVTGGQSLLNNGSSYSFSFSANPMRRMAVGTSYTKTANDSLAASTALSNSNAKVFLVFTDYQFRKMIFTAGYTNLNQFVSASGLPTANYTNFYVGIQRWFKAF